MNDYQVLGEGEMGSKCLMINGFLLGGDEHVLELDSSKAVFKNRHGSASSEWIIFKAN